MAYSYVTYTGDGSAQIYTVPFPFIKQEDIHVFLDAEEVPAERIEWLSESSIKFDMPRHPHPQRYGQRRSHGGFP